MKNVIIEGARGLGKSTVSRILRDITTNSTLINFTGFNEDGTRGLEKIKDYYHTWTNFFNTQYGEENMLYIHDRYFFSEMVYSKDNKSYDFTNAYDGLVDLVGEVYEDFHLVFLVTSDEETVKRNLNREKAPLFGTVEDSVKKTFEDQRKYEAVVRDFESRTKELENVHVHRIEVRGLTPRDIADKILLLTN